MKKITFLLLSSVLMMACHQDVKQNSSKENQEILSTTKPQDIMGIPWEAKVDSTTSKILITQNKTIKSEDLDHRNITQALVKKYPEIKLEWLKQQHDTVFVKIPDATYLTQGSGDMGADIFMAEAVYAYTQIQGVKFVNFSFLEGDHASPGTFNRSSFPFSK